MNGGPSRLWVALLRYASHAEDREYIVADALEGYAHRAEAQSVRAARRWLRGQAFAAVLPGLAERRRRRRRAPRGVTPPRGGVSRWLEDLVQDSRHAARSLRRSPALVLLVVGSLGVGIGATTIVFSTARSLLFPPAGPLSAPHELVTVYESAPTGEPWRQVSFPNFQEFEEGVPALADAAALRIGVVRLGESTDGERLIVELVTGNYFDVTGIPAVLGRTFDPDETRIGSAEALVVISYEFWQSRFEGSADVLGQILLFDGRPHTVIGVAPPNLVSRLLQMRVSAWIPLGIPGGTYNADTEELSNRADREYLVLARRAQGATLADVEGQLTRLAASIGERFPELWQDDRGQPRAFTALAEAESRLPPDFRMV